MAQVVQNSIFDPTQTRKIVTQAILNYLSKDNSLFTLSDSKSPVNGIMELFTISHPQFKSYDQAITIADFNPTSIKIDSKVIKVTNRKYLSFPVFYKQAIDFFASKEKADKFIAELITSTTRSLYLYERALAFNFIKALTADTHIEIEAASNSRNTLTDTEVKKVLYAIRKQIISLKTASTDHTKFAKDAAAKAGGKFQFPYGTTIKNLVLVLNHNFETQLGDLLATTYNKDELLSNVKKVYFDFDKIADEKGVKVVIDNKVIGFLLDRKAVIRLFWHELHSVTKVLKGTQVFEDIIAFEYVRNPVYPVIKISTKAPTK